MKVLLAALLIVLPFAAMAQENKAEAELMQAMAYSKVEQKRIKEPGEAIRALVREKVLALKPDRRMDYTDYRIVKRPATFLGQELVVVEEEYLTKYIGCCVNEGIGAILRVTGDRAPLEAFAKENLCKLREQQHVLEDLRNIGMKNISGEYTAISCRERDTVELTR
ncbi:hypothetical protein GJW-30_1_01459 [Variibacter gotjawalensis]|uniref:Uncharacterized protein n=1 Tax=Variibacter gotjawalensis TaxID=1333996 RepID=A0A0S3PSS0_9BRAD|nr:hypothetical protein [Variibacter gotjawalensis]NIK49244.1 hypothetical protein [Variibacter gotjawalensis]RZS51096.1 hypothetical protein EV661_3570 [Variibacter gotjawalensis]BAT58931.1 hypothetical protein GJW-30_1_01459 [Variibacter gotjawalensis]